MHRGLRVSFPLIFLAEKGIRNADLFYSISFSKILVSLRYGFSAAPITHDLIICNSNCTAAGIWSRALQLVSSLWTSSEVSGMFYICVQQVVYQRTVGIDLSSFWDWSLVARQRYGKIDVRKTIQHLTIFQVFVPNHNCVRADYSRRSRWNMLCIATKWFHLHLGCWSCWAQICKILRVYRCLLVLHVLDNLCGQQLPSMSIQRSLEKCQ